MNIPEHSDTLQGMIALATVYSDQRRTEDALRLGS